MWNLYYHLYATSKECQQGACKNQWESLSGPAMKVGIVGAGISGVVAGAHLKAAGIDVTIFERSAEAGGVW